MMSDEIELNTQQVNRPPAVVLLLGMLRLAFMLLVIGVVPLVAYYLTAFLTRGLQPALADMVVYGFTIAVAQGGLAAVANIDRPKRGARTAHAEQPAATRPKTRAYLRDKAIAAAIEMLNSDGDMVVLKERATHPMRSQPPAAVNGAP